MKPIRHTYLHHLLWIGLVCLVTGNATAEELYRWVDRDGKVHYSDLPPPPETKNVQQKRLPANTADADNLPYAIRQAIEKYPVTLYIGNCGSLCDEARALLTKRGVPFSERNAETDATAAKALKELVGGLEIPTLQVGTNTIKGLIETTWNSALDQAGYPRVNPGIRYPAKPPASPAAPAGDKPADKAAADAPPPAQSPAQPPAR